MSSSRRSFLTSAGLLGGGLVLPLEALAQASSKKLILVFAYGGWDATYVMDPKLDSNHVDGPEAQPLSDDPNDFEEVRCFGDLPICLNDLQRPAVSSFFEAWGDRCSAVNGIWVGSIAHAPSTTHILTGRESTASPDLAAVVGASLGFGRPSPYLDLGGRGIAGPLRCETLRGGYRGQAALLMEDAPGIVAPTGSNLSYPLFEGGAERRSSIRELAHRRMTRLLEQQTRAGRHVRALEDLAVARESAQRIGSGNYSLDFLDRGRISDLHEQLAAATELLDQGFCQSVGVDTRLDWDTHGGNYLQAASFDELFAELDFLAADLEIRGMLDDTLVLVTSEMCRTPRLNNDEGKDHWHASNALLFGGGITGGRALGGTDEYQQPLGIDPHSWQPWAGGNMLHCSAFAAGVLAALDIDPQPWFPDVPPSLALVTG